MTVREQLGWRIPRDERDAFESFVEQKWGAKGPYVRFEIESAMREYLDSDDQLAEAETLLRDHLDQSGLSSSSQLLTGTVDHSDTVKLGHRINAELKDEFASWAKEHFSDSLGAILAKALNAYRDGGRSQRILEAVQRLITGGTTDGTTADADESTSEIREDRGSTDQSDESSTRADERTTLTSGTTDGTTADADESVAVEPRLVIEIAEELPDQFPQHDLDAAIATTVDGNPETITAYREAVTDYKNVVQHPHRESFYITETRREETTYWADLNRELRAVWLRRLVVFDALDRGKQRHHLDYSEVQDIFEDNLGAGPSHDYAYTLMEDAAVLDGFEYGEYRGQYQLRVNVRKVDDAIVDDVLEEYEYLDREELTVNGLITGYSSGSAPHQEGAADD